MRESDGVALIDDLVQPINGVIPLVDKLIDFASANCKEQELPRLLNALIGVQRISEQSCDIRQCSPRFGDGEYDLAEIETARRAA